MEAQTIERDLRERVGEKVRVLAISRPVLARFSDVAGKQFSSLASNRDRIKSYLAEILQTPC